MQNRIDANAQRQALAQNNQQLLSEIEQLAKVCEQAEGSQQLKQMASEICNLAKLVKYNEQTEHQL